MNRFHEPSTPHILAELVSSLVLTFMFSKMHLWCELYLMVVATVPDGGTLKDGAASLRACALSSLDLLERQIQEYLETCDGS